jgi:hypothetical protein
VANPNVLSQRMHKKSMKNVDVLGDPRALPMISDDVNSHYE